MTPTYEEYKTGSTTWRKDHEGISIFIGHHGVRNEPDCITGLPHPGTWTYYLLIPEQMYPDQWADFACTRSDHGFEHNGPAFDGIDFHGGITWSSSEPYFCRKTMRQWDLAKVGCNYGHLWDAEGYYHNGYDDVLRDAKRSAKQLLEAYPDRHHRCGYTGVWSPLSETYVAKNGCRVNESVAKRDGITEHWLPKVAA